MLYKLDMHYKGVFVLPETKTFLQNLQYCKCTEHLSKILTFNLAPVLKNIKPAELVILKNKCFADSWQKEKIIILEKLGLSCTELLITKDSTYILFYNHKLLHIFLQDDCCQQLLLDEGYVVDNASVEILLEQLSGRLSQDCFPHEIGLFLGYPVQDVKAFITFGGKNYSACRYWKVYTDVENSLKKFQEIDDIRKSAARMLNSRMSIDKAINLLKAV